MLKSRHTVLFALTAAALVVPAHSAHAAADQIQFTVSRLHLEGKLHFVIPADLDGDGVNELLVSHLPDGGAGGKVLALYKTDDGRHYGPHAARTISLDPKTGVVDVGDLNSDGRDDLFFTSDGRLSAYLTQEGGLFAEKPSTIFEHPYNLPYSREKAFRFKLAWDLNHDGRDDLFLTTMEGYALFLQNAQGRFPREPSQVFRLDYSSMMWEEGENIAIKYEIPFPTQLDINGDGTLDLVFSDGVFFHFFPFDPEQSMYGPPKVVKLPVEKPVFGMLRSVVDDIDGDGVPDILMMRVLGKKMQTNENYLFKGRPGLEFLDKPDQAILSEGAADTPVVLDLDGDGRKELITSSVKIGLSMFIDYFLRNRVRVDFSIYRIKDRSYEEDPVMVRSVYFKTEEEEGTPGAEQADFNGDGIDDFVLASQPEKLSFYLTDPDVLLPDEPTCEVEIPSYGVMVAEDLNGDGKDDIAITYPIEKRKGDFTILISGGE